MKGILSISLFCAVLFSGEICYAQVNVEGITGSLTVVEQLVGRWQIDEKSVLMEMGSLDKERHEKMPTEIKNEFGRSLASRIFSFYTDGVFNANWVAGDKSHHVVGRYSVIGEGAENFCKWTGR